MIESCSSCPSSNLWTVRCWQSLTQTPTVWLLHMEDREKQISENIISDTWLWQTQHRNWWHIYEPLIYSRSHSHQSFLLNGSLIGVRQGLWSRQISITKIRFGIPHWKIVVKLIQIARLRCYLYKLSDLPAFMLRYSDWLDGCDSFTQSYSISYWAQGPPSLTPLTSSFKFYFVLL